MMGRERTRTWLNRAEALGAALVLAVAAVGLALVPVTTSACVRALVTAVGSSEITGLSEEGTFAAAEAVRVFVLDAEAPALPETLEGAPAFDSAAVSHLIDVREVLVPARRLTVVLVLLAVTWIALRARTPGGRRLVAGALRGAGTVVAVGAGLALVVGLLDFGSLFAWFHSLFFEAGTWMFPASALLIRVFPTAFWVGAGALWGALVLMFAAGMFIAGRRLGFTQGNYGV